MFLSKQEIETRFDDFIEGGNRNFIREVSYDLCVGDEIYRSEERLPEMLSLDKHPYILIRPGQFALVKTLEKVKVPKEYVGFISIRSEYKFQGLVNVSGFHVDPTFVGHLIFAVQNVGPNDIRLRYKEPVFMMLWATLSRPYEPTPDARKRTGFVNIPMNLMAQLGGSSITISELKAEVDRLHTQVKFFVGIGIALLMAVIAVILRMISQK
jgi:dCTP deaminase